MTRRKSVAKQLDLVTGTDPPMFEVGLHSL